MSGSYVVAVVLDTEFGERLLALASRMPVWIVDIPTNRAAAQRCWDLNTGGTQLHGVTTFKIDQAQSPETWLLEILANVDLHHGQYSQSPPYRAVEVCGAGLTSELREAFAELGLVEFVERSGGFVATKTSIAV
jgi:hypothetical protein